jgi:hypothetical protein
MNWKSLIVIIVLFLGALIAGRFLSMPPAESSYETLTPLWCQPALGPCRYPVDNLSEIEFTLDPRANIQPMEPLKARVRFSNPSGRAMAMTLTGLNMEMGYNRFRFQPVQNQYEADIIIPVCTLVKMEWQALVEIEIDDRNIAVPFNFVVERN